MKITYTGQAKFHPAQQRKLDAKFAKLGKLLDRRGEKEAHVILTTERHLNRAEITVNYYDHPLVGVESHTDAMHAVQAAIDKLEKQIVRLRGKWRDTKRKPDRQKWASAGAAEAPVKPAKKAKAAVPSRESAPAAKRVFRISNGSSRKPITLDEALLELDGGKEYTVYRDAETDRVHVLVKRRDGNFDLIEG
jgi:putative sigma-54 modulation protein